jgi:Putative prokaryotic signal transducing protein
VSDLAVLEVVATEPEAELLCSLLRDAGIPCMQRMTNMGAGAGEGTPIFGPREVLVRREQLPRARKVLRAQQRRAP